MKPKIANCPACGGPVEFQLSTALVTVCDFCHTVVARADKKIEDHGKVADLIETNSPIKRGLTGTFDKKEFEVVGQVQYQHPAGGVWDEWYLKFPGDRVRWLAAAQGKFYLTTEKRLRENTQLPDFESLTPGHRFQLPDGKQIQKVAPLAAWTMREVYGYLKAHGIAPMPLYELGYTSIGCEPCTSLPSLDSNDRSGRWGGKKLECGIHIQAAPAS